MVSLMNLSKQKLNYPMIKFQNITKTYPSNRTGGQSTIALENVSFEVQSKEFVSIVGKSGAGKTTLLRLLLGEEIPTCGRVFFEGDDIHKIISERLPDLRRKIGAVFQDYKLLSAKSAYENIAYAMEVIDVSDKEIRRDVPQVLEVVGLEEKTNNFPAELSGGEKQRLAIARALIHRPQVILADEPTGNLDPYHTLGIIKLLYKINQMGTTVILATHDKETINRLGKRVITLENGKVIRDEERGRFIL
jgi:cell division transport system ATP-binding protein